MSLRASSVRPGRITVLPTQRRVLLDGRNARIGGRAFDLLQALLAHRGGIVTKRELLDSAWPGLVVEENNLQVQICMLRKLLGPQAIVTVPGRGYVFDASIAIEEADAPAPIVTRPGASSAASATPLYGREAECAALAQLVREQRVVTVVGPAGVGKSRLVRDVLDGAAEVVTRAEFGLARGFTSVADSVARALDLGFTRAPSARQVAGALGGGSTLLVLENAEQVLDEAGELAEELEAAPGVRLVCTSQAPLQARDEHVLRLAPLPVPASEDAPDAMASPAVKFLMDSVAALQPRPGFSESEKHDAVAICRHLDGVPLAIELAASRVPLLGLGCVRRMLPGRFRLLTRVSRGLPARHQSLAAAMQWSWDLLTPVEREAMCALARYPGRFTLGMARAALEGISPTEWDAMELVSSLVGKSAVLAESGIRSGFRMLESMRLFAQAQPHDVPFTQHACG